MSVILIYDVGGKKLNESFLFLQTNDSSSMKISRCSRLGTMENREQELQSNGGNELYKKISKLIKNCNYVNEEESEKMSSLI